MSSLKRVVTSVTYDDLKNFYQMMKAFQHFTSSASLQLIENLNLVPTNTYRKWSIKRRTSNQNNLISVALE